jgi:dinuclear metal center YbgI/SA1388 family protein
MTGKIMQNVSTRELCAWIDSTLSTTSFNDYCPNGLQVEGQPQVSHIIAGVTACEALIDEAIARGADTLLVHHGWFWKGEDPRVRGTRKTRLAKLLANNINLLAYHLPLDAHPVLGNNAQLAQIIGLVPDRQTLPDTTHTANNLPVTAGPGNLIWLGSMPGAHNLGQIAQQTEKRLNRSPLVIGDMHMEIERIAWCTGAAHSMLGDAIDAGAQCFITGEISEPVVHLARESGVAFISAGHHATERYGVQALGREITRTFNVRVDFIDIDNPV